MSSPEEYLVPTYRYEPPSPEFTAAEHLTEEQEDALTRHREAHLGVAPNVLHEMVSDTVHLDLWPHPERAGRGVTLVTQGASALPMTGVPAGVPERFELLTYVDPSFLDVASSGATEELWWPGRMLKMVGRFPFEYGTWIGQGHTLTFSNPPEALVEGSLLTAVLLMPPPEADGFSSVQADGSAVEYLWAMPITTAELELKLTKGTETLLDALDAAQVPFTCNAGRACSVTGAKRRSFFRH